MDDLEEKLRRYICDELDFRGDTAELVADYPLIEKDVLDSMGIFQIISFLEDEVGIEVDDEDLVVANFASIGAITQFVTAKL